MWFQLWVPRPLIEVHAHLRFQLWAPRPVIAVCAHLGFHVWAPSPLLWVHAAGLQVSARAAYLAFTVQGLRVEGCQSWWLLRRVL